MPGFCSANQLSAPSRRLAAVVLPPSARVPPGRSARLTMVSCGSPSTITRWSPTPWSGCGQSGAHDAWIRVMWSMTIALPPARLTDHLEPERALGALLEPPHHGVDRLFERQPLDLLGDLVDLQAQAAADQPDVAAPHHGRDRRQQHHRHLVHRAAETARHLDRVRLVVGRVVEDLLAVDRLDPGAQPRGDHGERVVAPARVDAADEQRRRRPPRRPRSAGSTHSGGADRGS